MNYLLVRKILPAFILVIVFIGNILAAPMIEVSVDAIEIKSSKENNRGVSWEDGIALQEGFTNSKYMNITGGSAPSIFSVDAVERTGALKGTIRALLIDNQARVLANPKLATESGSQASFLVGGEIPIPVASAQGVSLEWKTYGVNLQIRPEIKDKSDISAMIQVSVSDLDYANSVKLQGYDVPALLNRSANSKVIVSDGGTVVIAGLKQTRKETTETRVPILGSLPIIGWAFKSVNERDNETSMVIFVTFKILK
ncbi:MAG: type II and III secretion system protein [Elusimicrobiota bacterium]